DPEVARARKSALAIARRIRGPISIAKNLAPQSASRQNRNGRSKFAAGDFNRQEIHESWPVLPRPNSGRQYGPDESRREIRVSPRLQIFDLCDVVDSSGNYPFN